MLLSIPSHRPLAWPGRASAATASVVSARADCCPRITVSTSSTVRPPTLLPLAVLAFCLAVTVVGTVFFLVTARARDEARFELLVRITLDRIEGHLDSDVTLLRGAAGLFTASREVTAEEFRLYVERLDVQRYEPGVQGVGFSRRIPAREKEAWEERLRASGQPLFHLWPEQARPEYHAILYLEPLDSRNRAALGYDMFTEPTRRAAMLQAWLSGEPALSGRVTLQQEIDENVQSGFLLYVPVYEGGGVPATEAERRERLEGFVYSPFRAEDLFTRIFPPEHRARVSFRVYDSDQERPERLLYDSQLGPEEHSEDPVYTTSTRLWVAGRPWTVVFTSQPSFERGLLTPWVPAVGVTGVLLSLMVFAVVWSQSLARVRAEANEAERTRLLAREQAAHAEAEAQRTYLHELFMQAPALIAILGGPQHVIEFANTTYRQIMGNRELEGRPLREAAPELPPDILALFDDIYRTGQPRFGQEMYIPMLMASGEVLHRYWNFIWQPRRSPAGGVDGVLIFAFEVTEQVRARQEAEARREEARRSALQLQTITDALPALVAYIDSTERYRFVNRTYEAWFGVKVEDLLGKTVEEFVGAQGYAQVKDRIHQALAGEEVHYESSLTLKDGRTLYVQPNYIPDRDARGQVQGYVGLLLDLTERKQAEEAVRNAVRLRDEFLSVASHELKTPLTPLSLKLQTLAREAENQPDSPFVRKVRNHTEAGLRQLKRLGDLIGDLLDVSRISSGQMKLRWEPVDFAGVVRDVVARLEPEATKAASPLMVEAPQALEGRSDRMRLEQVVENLLTNAIKYGAGKPIHVQMEAMARRVVLRVRDEGIGIAPEHQARIFERFERAVSERNYGGLGLGLYITHTLVETMGGSIQVQSQLGQGALFTVELPREPESP